MNRYANNRVLKAYDVLRKIANKINKYDDGGDYDDIKFDDKKYDRERYMQRIENFPIFPRYGDKSSVRQIVNRLEERHGGGDLKIINPDLMDAPCVGIVHSYAPWSVSDIKGDKELVAEFDLTDIEGMLGISDIDELGQSYYTLYARPSAYDYRQANNYRRLSKYAGEGKRYLGNALSLGMLDHLTEGTNGNLSITGISLEDAKRWASQDFTSCVGHSDTAALISNMLDTDVQMNRMSTSLKPGDELLVAQYNGPRLPEGATSLPEGARIRWMLVKVN